MEKETIGQKLKRLRKEKGLTQKELGDLSGIHVSQLSRYEKDINKPSLDTIFKICQSSNIDYKEFDVSLLGLLHEDNIEKNREYLKKEDLEYFIDSIKYIPKFEVMDILKHNEVISKITIGIFYNGLDNDLELSIEEITTIRNECEKAYQECLKLKLFEMYFNKEELNKLENK